MAAAIRMAMLVMLVGAVMPQPQFIPDPQPFIPGPQPFIPAPQSPFVRPFIPILSQEQDGPNLDGSYHFSYDSADGSSRSEISEPTSPFTHEVRGSYSYTAPDGQLVTVNYVADENGYRAESPTGSIPQIPPHSLQQLQAAEPAFARDREQNRLNAEIRFNQRQIEEANKYVADPQLRFDLLERQRAAAKLRLGLAPSLRPFSPLRPIPNPHLLQPVPAVGAFNG